MESTFNFIKDHWADMLAIYGALVALATIIVKLTRTQADDAILAKIIKVMDYFSTVNPKPAKV